MRRAVFPLAVVVAVVGLLLGCEPEVRTLGRKKEGVNTSASALGGKGKKDRAAALKTVRVGEGQEEMDFTRNGGAKQDLPQIDAFGDLPTDTVRGAATQAAGEATTRPNEPVTIFSKIQLITRPSRRGAAPAPATWTRGSTELLRPVKLKVGEEKSTVLGTAQDGCELRYAIGWKDEKDQTPVQVELRVWGARTGYMKFTALLGPEDGKTFHAATREGDQIRFDLAVELPAEAQPKVLESVRDRMPR